MARQKLFNTNFFLVPTSFYNTNLFFIVPTFFFNTNFFFTLDFYFGSPTQHISDVFWMLSKWSLITVNKK